MSVFNRLIMPDIDKINFGKVLAVPLWIIENSEHKRADPLKFSLILVRRMFSCIYHSLLAMPVVHGSTSAEGKTFFLRTYSRQDLNKHSEIYESAIKDKLTCVLSMRRKGLSFIPLLAAITMLFRSWKAITHTLAKNDIRVMSQEGSELILILLQAFSEVSVIFPYIQNSSRLVSFQEMVPVENLACQLANASGIKTFALQHALGAYSESGTYETRYSKVHYSASVCSVILAWGEYSKRDFQKFTGSKINLVGKPALPEIASFVGGVTFIFEADDRINLKLLSMAAELEEMGVEVSRWYRPGHRLVVNGVTRDGPLRKIIIGWRSSLLVELGFLGAATFVIRESVFADSLPSDLVVESANDIQERLNSIAEYPHDTWKRFIGCTGDESIRRYRQAIFGN